MEQTFEERKKAIYDFMSSDLYVPMKIKEIAIILQIPREKRSELKEVLQALEGEGKISVSSKGKYIKNQATLLTGVFQANARGFGFVLCEGEEGDVFISGDNTGGAFQGDQVEFTLLKGKESGSTTEGKRREGKIVSILSHGTVRAVGLYEKCKKYGFVRPDSQRLLTDIYIPEGKDKGAMTGHKVVVELTSYGGNNTKPEGKVLEVIGHVNDPGTDILSIIKDYDIPVDFPEKVLNQAERAGSEVSQADMTGRMDLRTWQMVTIDGEDAKDLDDAISLAMEGDSYRLGVHIADVANYVQEKSALDQEALKRGTSVYLADRVIPMLPHKLSNGICSLNAGENRLALSCIMTINSRGEVTEHVIAETVICVDERMSYTSVANILEEQEQENLALMKESSKYPALVPMFLRMKEVSQLLRGKRRKRGSIDFDFPETKMILDERGKPVEIKAYDRNVATEIIEDFMLLANETVAEEYFWRESPFLYRIHEQPDEERIRTLSTFINNFGYHIHVGEGDVKSMEVQKLLAALEGTTCEPLISRLVLRSMKRARYTPENTGHFGLAAKYYTHFTSPIRRYPDLQIHRIIKENIRGRMDKDRAAHYEKNLSSVASQSSELERRAEEAERETIKLKKAEYMQEHIGEEFDGVISGVTKWGAYVELDNTVEGLVHVSNMKDDHYEYVEAQCELFGERTRKTYKLGEKTRVRILGTDILQRTIDFEFCDQ